MVSFELQAYYTWVYVILFQTHNFTWKFIFKMNIFNELFTRTPWISPTCASPGSSCHPEPYLGTRLNGISNVIRISENGAEAICSKCFHHVKCTSVDWVLMVPRIKCQRGFPSRFSWHLWRQFAVAFIIWMTKYVHWFPEYNKTVIVLNICWSR